MKKMIRKGTAIVLGLIMVMQLCCVTSFAAKDVDAVSKNEKSNDAHDGQVIVKYRAGALKEKALSLKSERKVTKSLADARKKSYVASSFGDAEYAVMSENSVIDTVEAQADILSDVDGFVIEDTVDFSEVISGSDAPVYSLISSKKHSTEELQELLSQNPDVVSVTPNYAIHTESMPEYSMNDTYANFMTHLNSPDTVNTSGKRTDSRGYSPEEIPTMNASCAWEKADDQDPESEKPVVAIVDTGIDCTHEDLQDSLWTNPGDIGLRGFHGFSFVTDTTELIDGNGHGTHCAGIIAAQRNNETGVAGVAGNAVEIMGLRVLNNDGSGVDQRVFGTLAAYQYILKAKKNGVNITVCSNSWGGSAGAYIDLDDVFEALYEAGILVVFAAGNDTFDTDKHPMYPAACNSEGLVRVGSICEDGNISSFSNYGSSTTDIFAQGDNILSSVSKQCYYPCIYTPERLKKTTAYYGEYSVDMASGVMAPVIGDDGETDYTGVKGFGKPTLALPDGVTADLTIEKSHSVNISKKPAELVISLHGLKNGSDCYLYYPYDKSPYDNGTNFDFSVGSRTFVSDPYSSGKITAGEIISKKDGSKSCTGKSTSFSKPRNTIQRHYSAKTVPYSRVDRDDVAGYGIGVQIHVDKTESGEAKVKLNHIAVSRESVSGNYGKYDVYSGTSMACPAAAGAAALLSYLEPAGSKAAGGAKGKNYTKYLKNRLFSLARHSKNLEERCLTEGYIDLSLIDQKQPVISDVKVDADKKTITLIGANLKSDKSSKLSCKRVIEKDTEYRDISGQATWSSDGTKITIKKAGNLIGTQTRFMVTNAEGTGTGSFFLVKGEKSYKEVFQKNDSIFGKIFTDSKKKRVVTFDGGRGELYEWNGKNDFKLIKHKKSEGLFSQIIDSFDDLFDSTELIYANEDLVGSQPLDMVIDGDKLKYFMEIAGGAEQQMIMATFDLNRKKTVTVKKKDKKTNKVKKTKKKVFKYQWDITPIKGLDDGVGHVFVVGKTIYAIRDNSGCNYTDELDKNIYKLKNGTWKKTGIEMPEDYFNVNVVTYKNKAYFMNGSVPGDEDPDKLVASYQEAWKDSSAIYSFDGKKFKKMKTEFPRVIRHCYVSSGSLINKPLLMPALAEGPKGILIYGMSMDGYGNTACYDPAKDRLSAIPATIEPGIASEQMDGGAATKKEFFVMRRNCYAFQDDGFDVFRLKL